VRRLALLIVVPALLALPAGASALTVTKAELRGGQLRLEGTGAAPGGVTARSSTSTAFARVFDPKGAFKLQASGFRADDCTVIVSDGSTPIAQPTLAGCTPVAPTPPITDPPPSGSCVIAPGAPATFTVGDVQSYFFETTGCDTSSAPVQWALVAGRIPPGMDAPISQGQTAGEVSGRPTTEGTYTFTVQVTDSAGATDVETFTITVTGPRPVSITNPSALPPATRGQAYQVNLAADGGLPGYAWAVTGGTLPPGLRLSANAIAGTPTATGTFGFTVTATDSRGATGSRAFTLTVG
jgi:putative Ig domain-containing protein